MIETLTARDLLSEMWHKNIPVWNALASFGFPSDDLWQAFCVSKDWIQDTAEALLCHRRRGFSEDQSLSYIEFYGVMQAGFLLQDSVTQLCWSFGIDVEQKDARAWTEFRDRRNWHIGHPVKSDRSKDGKVRRTSIPRQSFSYNQARLTLWVDGALLHKSGDVKREFASLDLDDLLSRLDTCVALNVKRCTTQLASRLPHVPEA